MDWIETLQLRSYRKPDRDAAIASFHELILSDPESGLGDIVLLQDAMLDNDLCIVIRWQGEISRTGKSSLGLKLAAAFSEFGRIYHNVWRSEVSIAREYPRKAPSRLRSRSVGTAETKAMQNQYS